jgi:hypothetical protein
VGSEAAPSPCGYGPVVPPDPGRLASVVAAMTAVLVVLIVGMHTGPAGWWNGRTADAAAATLSSPSRSAAATPS